MPARERIEAVLYDLRGPGPQVGQVGRVENKLIWRNAKLVQEGAGGRQEGVYDHTEATVYYGEIAEVNHRKVTKSRMTITADESGTTTQIGSRKSSDTSDRGPFVGSKIHWENVDGKVRYLVNGQEMTAEQKKQFGIAKEAFENDDEFFPASP
jgi:hypothetical protein